MCQFFISVIKCLRETSSLLKKKKTEVYLAHIFKDTMLASSVQFWLRPYGNSVSTVEMNLGGRNYL